MMEPDFGNYYKDGYKWYCFGKCTFNEFVVAIDVEDNFNKEYFLFLLKCLSSCKT